MSEETPLPFITPWEHIQKLQRLYARLPQLQEFTDKLVADDTPLPAELCDELGLPHGATIRQGCDTLFTLEIAGGPLRPGEELADRIVMVFRNEFVKSIANWGGLVDAWEEPSES
jgi:hypothetical protein